MLSRMPQESTMYLEINAFNTLVLRQKTAIQSNVATPHLNQSLLNAFLHFTVLTDSEIRN